MTNRTIGRPQAVAMIMDAGNRIFSVSFIKRSGEKRDMVCRRKVGKGVTGKGMSYDPAEKALVVVYDMDDKGSGRGHKTIPVDTVYRLKMNGVEYTVVDG